MLTYDYAGFGLSEKELTEQRLLQDAEKVFSFATTELKLRPRQIVLHGQSLGTVPTIHLASVYTCIAGVVLVSPFIRLPNPVKAAFFQKHR